ncbi:MAG: phosphodiester glycosidase family protein [Armatimonadetes bacterium]|nr:phosphodiester glycosidase family protein [Armatimonadota bacterium]
MDRVGRAEHTRRPWYKPFVGLRSAVIVLGCCGGMAAASPITYTSFSRGKAVFHAVVADTSTDLVSPETLFAPRLQPLKALFGGEEPTVAITGTFFAWENQKPVGDVVVDGDLMAMGRRGSVLAVDWFGKLHIFHPPFRSQVDWYPYRYALRGTVRLVDDGKVVPDPRSQHFRDKSIWGKAARTAVGLTGDGKIVLLATVSAVSLSQLGWAMVGFGVKDAVSLDGGGSTALFYRGKMVVSTGRRLNNLFVLYERSPFDAGYRTHLGEFAKQQSDSIIQSLARKRKS